MIISYDDDRTRSKQEERGKFENWEVFLDIDCKNEEDFIEETVYFLPVVEKAPMDYYPDDVDYASWEVGDTYERIMGLVLRWIGKEKDFERIGIFDVRGEGKEALLEGMRFFEGLAEEVGVECFNEGMREGERKYLVVIR